MVWSYPIESLIDEKKKQIEQYEQRIIAIEKDYEEGGDEKKCQEEMSKIKTEIGKVVAKWRISRKKFCL